MTGTARSTIPRCSTRDGRTAGSTRASITSLARASSRPDGRATSRMTSSGRGTILRPSASTIRTKTRTASRPRTRWRRSVRCSSSPSPRSSARSNSAPTRIDSPPRRPGAASSAPTFRPTTSTSRRARRTALVRRAWNSASTSTDASASKPSTPFSATTWPARSSPKPTTSRSTPRAEPIPAPTFRPTARSRRCCGWRRGRASTTSRPPTRADTSAIVKPTTGRCRVSSRATLAPVERLTLTGQVARGFRDPTLSDRYFRGPSGRGFITGNPDLEPETSLQYDLAARYAIGRTQLAAYGYHYRIDDLIERYCTATDFFFFRNRGLGRVRGIELEARTSLGYGVGVEAGMNISRGTAARRRHEAGRHLGRHRVLRGRERLRHPRLRPGPDVVRG